MKSNDFGKRDGKGYAAWRNFLKTATIFAMLVALAACGGGGGGNETSSVGVLSVVGITPGSGIDEVAVSAVISATFSADMDPVTITSDTFKVSGPDGSISGAVTYDSAAKVVTFTPTVPLLPLASYSATITAGAKDKSGRPLAGDYTWTFKTDQDALTRSTGDVIPATFFGMHIHRAATTTPWPSVPFAVWRLWDASVAWPYLEPNKGEWHFETLDTYVSKAEAKNVEILLPLGLTPTWASARPTEDSAYKKPGWAAEPANIEDWKNYVRTVATRYKGRIHNYEIWNEPNSKGFFSGTVEQMLSLAREAYTILKSIDPSIKVVSPAATTEYGISWLDSYLQAGGGDYSDIIGYHLYVYPDAPEAMTSLASSIRQTLGKYNQLSKPLWNTESGWSSPKTFSDPEEAAAYVARAHILNWVAGIERFYWYAWDNTNWVTLHLTETDSTTVTPAGIAYGEIQRWFIGAKIVSCGKNSYGTWVVQIVRENGYKGWIVWNPSGATDFELPKEWNAKEMKDLAGNKYSLLNSNMIKIGISPVLIGNTSN